MKKYQLMAPGPTPVPSEVLLAMAEPIIHHRTPQYDAVFIEIRAGLKRLVQTSAEVVPLACSGTGAMEAAVVNTLSAGDKVVVVRAGKFGDRWLDLARAYGLEIVDLSAPFGHTVEAGRLAEALKAQPDVKAVLAQHSETSTGVLHDVKAYAAVTGQHDAILIVDAVSSLGIADLPMDAWQVDLVVSGSQKGLMLPPGVGFCALSEKAWQKTKTATLPKFYFSLADELKYVAKNEVRFTPAVSIMVGLREALRMLEAEGLQNVFKRHDRLARATRAGVEALGLELFAKATPSPAMTSNSAAYPMWPRRKSLPFISPCPPAIVMLWLFEYAATTFSLSTPRGGKTAVSAGLGVALANNSSPSASTPARVARASRSWRLNTFCSPSACVRH